LLLRKLEAYGFKSFADKLELEFGQGVTAIVGPNGSGKSNITDAIRWVLGEQNIRNLRGVKTEDIIFAGSSRRRALGVAEVSLTFDNSDGNLPLDFNEVIITRRFYRSGDSEYFINKSQCRLKDIHDLLADTGLGRDAMTVISQNKIDEVLNSKPEERRSLFEEAAGITKYKNRKKEALRKLEDTSQNLTRVADISAEIETQLEPLAESAAKTARYNKINTELIACQATLLTNRLEKCNKLVESAELQKTALAEQELSISTSLSLKETEKERVSSEVAQTDEQIQKLAAKITEATTSLEKINGSIAVLDERIKQGSQAEVRINADIVRTEQQKHAAEMKYSELHSMLAQKQQMKLELDNTLAEKTANYQQLQAEIQQIDRLIENMKEKTFDQLQELVSERNNITTTERDLARAKLRQANFEKECAEYAEQLNRTTLLVDSMAAELQDLKTAISELSATSDSFLLDKRRLEQEFQEVASQEHNLAKKLGELNSRLAVLKSMQHEYEGFGRAIRGVLKSNAAWSSGVCGAVAEIITVPDQYVTAIEIALGGALQNIVTESDEVAKQAIHYLKTQKLGRATFLPLSSIKPTYPREGELAAAKAEGAFGFAANLVSYQPKYQKIVEFLLGRTIVAANIDLALKIARQHSFSVRIVTLDGELISAGGSMTGGSNGRREASFLSRASEIDSITRQVTEIANTVSDYQEKALCIKAELARVEQQLLQSKEAKQQKEVRHAELTVHLEKARHELAKLNLAVATVNSELASCTDEQNQLEATLVELKNKIAVLESRDSAQKQEVLQLQQKLAELQQRRESLSDNLTDTKIQVTTLQQDISVTSESCKQHEQNIAFLASQLQQLAAEKNNILLQIVQANQELHKLKNEYSDLSNAKTGYEIEHKEHYAGKLNKLAALQQIDKELKDLRRKQNDIQTRLHDAELLYTKYNYEAANCIEQLLTQYSLSVEAAQSLCRPENSEELAALIKSLETEIADLGPVNPNAIEEYEKLRERYQFMQMQYHDLVGAKEYLTTIIDDIDNTMAKQFMAAFREINEHFGHIFSRLFGGGQARLQLVTPDNLLETGIDIIVQPPGKKLQNLVLLSGGERALTVIALLFAFLSYRPAPFSVVDEIDAPLDEANLERFSDFLRDYSRNTQFIVVTHRKGTMEAADVIHGVTIEEAGVSRVVSVKLIDNVS